MQKVEYLIKSKSFLRTHSFDGLAIVLYVASRATQEKGVTERSIADALDIPRSTVNRLVKVLIDGKQITIREGSSPREFVYNQNFTEEVYGKEANLILSEFYTFVLDGYADAVCSILRDLTHSQFDNE